VIADGLYAVVADTWTAGFVVEDGRVTMCAPILRARLEYWMGRAQLVPDRQEAAMSELDHRHHVAGAGPEHPHTHAEDGTAIGVPPGGEHEHPSHRRARQRAGRAEPTPAPGFPTDNCPAG